MKKSQRQKIWVRNIIWSGMVTALLLGVAGRVDYWQAWVFVLTSGVSNFVSTYMLMKNAPNLLARRMKGGAEHETRRSQKIIMLFGQVAFISLMVLPALAQRWGLVGSFVAPWVSLLANGVAVLAIVMTYFVFRQNEFAAATVESFKNQKLASTGLYAVVRHPMYLATLLVCFATPIALGSWWGLVGAALWAGCVVFRIVDEEALLKKTLKGYNNYCRRTRHRLIPFIW